MRRAFLFRKSNSTSVDLPVRCRDTTAASGMAQKQLRRQRIEP
jgi:hypothetical protein